MDTTETLMPETAETTTQKRGRYVRTKEHRQKLREANQRYWKARRAGHINGVRGTTRRTAVEAYALPIQVQATLPLDTIAEALTHLVAQDERVVRQLSLDTVRTLAIAATKLLELRLLR